jgi:hypothetical protein
LSYNNSVLNYGGNGILFLETVRVS